MSSLAQRVVEVEHRVNGSPQEAFQYFTDPDKHAEWHGAWVDLDPRPGGVYIVHFNEQSRVRGSYVELDPPRRIVLAWGYESENQFPLPGMRDVPPSSTTVEISFIEDGDGTIIRVRHSGLPSEGASEFTTFGWTRYLERLGVRLYGQSPGPDPATRELAEFPNAD